MINGLLEPDLVLIGESDPESGAALEELYKQYNRNSPRIARMSIVSAELTKISVNSYITMKISFTNQLRMIADQFPKANIHAILEAIGSDSRIGSKYLRAGLSFGGPCFPRDNRLLAYSARQVGLGAPLAEATDQVNQQTNLDLFPKPTFVRDQIVDGLFYDFFGRLSSRGRQLVQLFHLLGSEMHFHRQPSYRESYSRGP